MANGEQQRANQLRKDGKLKDALDIYVVLWENNKDPYIGAGYLHCLRKLNYIDKAVKFAFELDSYHFSLSWVFNEIMWTLIEELKVIDDYNKAVILSNKLLEILNLEPNDLALKIICNRMAKITITKKKWIEGNNWLDKINKAELDDNTYGKTKWTSKTLWYYRKIKCMVELGYLEEGIALYEKIKDIHKPWEIQKQFLRILAKALSQSDKLEDSLQIYDDLSHGKIDWWILHEKGIILKKLGKKEEALKVFYTAANSFNQLDKQVTLFDDIGKLCLELDRNEEALSHFILEKLVREEKGWSIDSELVSLIESNIESFPDYKQLDQVKDVLSKCRNFWKQSGIKLEKEPKHKKKIYYEKDNRKTRIGLQGVVQIRIGSDYFFIKTENESIICFQSELINEFENGDVVVFDAQPSYDKKKKIESWVAINLKKKS